MGKFYENLILTFPVYECSPTQWQVVKCKKIHVNKWTENANYQWYWVGQVQLARRCALTRYCAQKELQKQDCVLFHNRKIWMMYEIVRNHTWELSDFSHLMEVWLYWINRILEPLKLQSLAVAEIMLMAWFFKTRTSSLD